MVLEGLESGLTQDGPYVLASHDDVPEAALEALADAARRSGVGLVRWTGLRAFDPEYPPALFVAGLARGSRLIAEPVVRALASLPSRVPLLLLCNEPLVRPTVTTQAGRVTLVGSPLSSALIASRIRMLLARTEDSPGDLLSVARESVGDPATGLATSEHRRPRYWVGTFGAGAGDAPPLPSLSQHPSTGLLAVIAAGAPADRDLDRVTRVLRCRERDDEKAAALSSLLGEDRALVYLEPGAEDWLAYLPRSDWSLTIFSPQRVPHMWNLAGSLERSGRKLARIAAAGGDVVVATTARAGGTSVTEQQRAMADGGPAVLGFLCSSLPRAGAFSGVVAEVL